MFVPCLGKRWDRFGPWQRQSTTRGGTQTCECPAPLPQRPARAMDVTQGKAGQVSAGRPDVKCRHQYPACQTKARYAWQRARKASGRAAATRTMAGARESSNRGPWRFVRVLGEARWIDRWSAGFIGGTLPAPRAPAMPSSGFFQKHRLEHEAALLGLAVHVVIAIAMDQANALDLRALLDHGR